jgi:hypothetical protein
MEGMLSEKVIVVLVVVEAEEKRVAHSHTYL